MEKVLVKKSEIEVGDVVVEKLAKRFSSILKEWIGREGLAKTNIENEKWIGTEDERCCASHEHCDANMAMDQAVREVLGDDFIDEEGFVGDDAIPYWDAAWNLAKKNKFYIGA